MTSKTKKEHTFAEARQRLDDILAELESDAGDVDQLAARLKEASELIRFCRDRLSAARHEVRQVVADLVPEAAEAEPGPPEASESEVTDTEAGDLPF